MIKYILFDVYGTLISTGNGSVNAVEKILSDKKVCITAKEFYAKWKIIHRKNIDNVISKQCFINERKLFENDLKELYEIYKIDADYSKDVIHMINSLYGRIAFPEAKPVLEKLKEVYKIALASTTDTKPLIENMKINDISADYIYTSESLMLYKPDVRFYKEILKNLGVSAEDALFVGDSVGDDIIVPKQLGMKTCWVNRKNSDNNTNINPDMTVSNLNELYKKIL